MIAPIPYIPTGIDRIAEERWRQPRDKEHGGEGFTAENDAQQKPGALTMAAITYSIMAASSEAMRAELRVAAGNSPNWPWEPVWWKPGKGDTHDDRIRELTKAGALLAAEIDRILAVKQRESERENHL